MRNKVMLRLLCFVCLLSAAFPLQVCAAGGQRLTVSYLHADITFDLYEAAALQEGGYIPSPAYSGYPVSFSVETAADYRALASTLAGLTQRDAIPPTASCKTGPDGKAIFEDLAPGLYLVIGDTYCKDSFTYIPSACLIELQGRPVSCEVKYEQRPTEAEPLALTVLKVWKDQERQTSRPQEIAVQLLKDGAIAETVTLSAECDWQYTWQGLEAGHAWSVTEQTVLKGYTVTAEQEQDIYVLTNTAESVPQVPIPESPKTGMLFAGSLYIMLLAALWMLNLLMKQKNIGQKRFDRR